MAILQDISNTMDNKGNKCVFLDHNSSLKKSRKRTSAQDQYVLEASYLQNAKPDKAERAAIVTQVELSEKEVQIWFQNRRQNDRRRSKPVEDVTEVLVDTSSIASSSKAMSDPTPSPVAEISMVCPITLEANKDVALDSSAPEEGSPSQQVVKSHRPDDQTFVPSSTPVETEKSKTDTDTAASSPGSARKRVHDEMAADAEIVKGTPVLKEVIALPPKIKEPIKRANSMRLAMTANGSVKIRTRDTPTPSPPKQRIMPLTEPAKRTKLTRSVSMFEPSQIFIDPPSLADAGHKKGKYGRSRDPRTWEFFCDNGVKDDLTSHAEAQRKGSAVGAINLLRSSSSAKSRPALGSLSSNGGAARVKSSKPKMARARSTLAVLQSAISPVDNAANIEAGMLTASSRRPRQPSCGPGPNDREDDGNDSDKENWLPGTRRYRHHLRVGGEYLVPFTAVGEQAVQVNDPQSRDSPAEVGRVDGNGVAHNVTSILGGGRPVAPDMEAVQSLLSLRAGDWH